MRRVWKRHADWWDVAMAVAGFFLTAPGITIGFHRLITHRSFKAKEPVKAALLVSGSMAVQGPPVVWARRHRKHHALADKPGDPHSPLEGMDHAHFGWIKNPDDSDLHKYAAPRIDDDPVVVWVNDRFLLWTFLTLAIPYVVRGWRGLLWGGLVRMFWVHHITWAINSICHTWGAAPFKTPDRSKNHKWLGLLALGEGWHNNHHAFPRSYRHGLLPGQRDFSAWATERLEKLGLVSDLYRVSADDIQKRRIRDASKMENLA